MKNPKLEIAPECFPVVGFHEISANSYIKRKMAERAVLICRVGDAVYVIEDRCSHAGMPLEGGALRGRCIVCPVHGAEFDVSTGRELSLPAIRPIRCFPVRIVNGYVEVSRHPTPAREPTPTFRLGM